MVTADCEGPGSSHERRSHVLSCWAILLKAEHESSFTPPDCTGVFLDVACPSTFANWIESLAAENITGGCGGGNDCPANPNTRGQMAVFIVKTFQLH